MTAKWPNWAEPVLAFLSGKRLLLTPSVEPRPSQEISIATALRVGRELEPRVLEVLPAAIIHFPANFTSIDAMPKELRLVVDAINKDRKEGPDFEGILYQAMKRWANIPLPDKRVIPAKEKRQMKAFRLHPDAIRELKKRSKKSGISEAQILDQLLLGAVQ